MELKISHESRETDWIPSFDSGESISIAAWIGARSNAAEACKTSAAQPRIVEAEWVLVVCKSKVLKQQDYVRCHGL
jgi:hypothetical protein